jgi:hypothetical protein
MCRALSIVVVSCGVVALAAPSATAQETDVETRSPLTVRTSIKATGLVSRSPNAPDLFPERTTADSMFRVRIEPEVRPSANTTVSIAYEQRFRYRSGATGLAAFGILPSEAATPFRIRPLVWRLSETPTAVWRHEIDRANAHVRVRRADITIGRQAIGWGRGVLFTAVDLFAPFSPLEADREWRAGVDAVRTDIKLTERSSIDLVGAFDRTLNDSAFAARARGYAGTVDLEVVGGRRAQDLFAGMTTSAAVGDAELHAEVAVFRVPADAAPDDFHPVWKVVVGGSYRFPIGSGILAYTEYHYSGFGAAHPEDIRALVSTPSFVERFIRGDLQILSRHAVGVTGSYEVSPEVAWSGQWLLNPSDHSGIVAPGLTYTFSDAVSLLATFYLPYGRPPEDGVLRSEYGAASLSGLLQLRLYF